MCASFQKTSIILFSITDRAETITKGSFFIVNNLVSQHCPEQVCLDELITFNANGALLHQL